MLHAPLGVQTEKVNVVEGGTKGTTNGGIEDGHGEVQSGPIQHQKNDITQIIC